MNYSFSDYIKDGKYWLTYKGWQKLKISNGVIWFIVSPALIVFGAIKISGSHDVMPTLFLILLLYVPAVYADYLFVRYFILKNKKKYR